MVDSKYAQKIVELWNPLSVQLSLVNDSEYLAGNILTYIDNNSRNLVNIERLIDSVTEFQKIKHLCDDSPTAELALWFSNLEYPIDSKHDGARLAKLWLEPLFEEAYIGRVVRLVSSVYEKPYDIDSGVLNDARLSFLGAANEDEFMKLHKLFVKDFGELSTDKYFTKLFLRPRIYHTEEFFNKYENNLRENIKGSIDLLI